MLHKIKADLDKFELGKTVSSYSGAGVGISIALIIAGAALWLLGISLTITWIIFCFGTVIIGILLLLFQSWILYAPLLLSVLGMRMIRIGFNNINISTPKKKKKESLSLYEAAVSFKKSQEYHARMQDESQTERVSENREKQRANMNKKSLTGKLEKLSSFYLITLDELLVEMNKAGIHNAIKSATFSPAENRLLMIHLSDSGNAIAQFGMGESYYRDSKYKYAIDLWNKALSQEDTLPKSHLGVIAHHIGLAYHFGLGLIIDNKEAVKWLIKSALIKESPFSQHAAYKLAEIYSKGDNIKISNRKAEFWANKALKGNSNTISYHAEHFLQMCTAAQIMTNSLREGYSPYEGVNWEDEMPTKKPKTVDDAIPF